MLDDSVRIPRPLRLSGFEADHPVPARGAERTRSSLHAIACEHRALLLATGMYVLVAKLAPIELPWSVLRPPAGMLVLFTYVAALVILGRWWARVRTGLGPAAAFRGLWTPDFVVGTLGGAALVYWIHLVTLQTFLHWKSRIPQLNPFAWDATLANWDRALHGGRHPWELLQPALGRPELTLLLDRTYILWFVVLTFVVLWQCFAGDRETRTRFFLSYVLSWVLVREHGSQGR